MMDTAYYCERINRTHDHGPDSMSYGDDPGCKRKHISFCRRKYRSDQSDGKKTGEQYRAQRRHKKIDHLRNMPVQPVFQLTHDPDCNDNRNHMSLISNLPDRKTKQMPYRNIRCVHRCYRPCIDKIRMDHDHTDDRTQKNISAKYSCR